MAKKKASVEDNWPTPTPERQWLVPSGWCSDKFHERCKYQFTYGKCGCLCHIGELSED